MKPHPSELCRLAERLESRGFDRKEDMDVPNKSEKDRILHRTIINGDLTVVNSVALKTSVHPDVITATIESYKKIQSGRGAKGASPLFAAIYNKDEEMCKYLLDEGADVNSTIYTNIGPLVIALQNKMYETATLLIESGANVFKRDQEGRTPIYFAIKTDAPLSIIKRILDAGFPKDEICYSNGIQKRTPLMAAIERKNLPLMKFLLEQNVEVDKVVMQYTPLAYAIMKRSPDTVKVLIDNGANVDGILSQDYPPLYFAVKVEEPLILKMLIDAGANVNKVFTGLNIKHLDKSIQSLNILQVAILLFNFPAIKILLKNGADINGVSFNNETPLHTAFGMACDHVKMDETYKKILRKIIKYLLEKGADTNALNVKRKSPIQLAFTYKNTIALEEYVQFGADSSKVVDDSFGSIFRFAICNERNSLAEVCISYGADCYQRFHDDPIYLDILRSDNPFILRLFWKNFYPCDAVRAGDYPKNSKRVLKLLQSQLRFIQSVHINCPETVKLALQQGAEVNCKSKHLNDVPLHVCATRGNTELAKVLLESGAKISPVNSSGYTALHVAALNGHLDTCKLLLQYGACVDSKGPRAATPCQLAKSAGHKKVAHFLKTISRYFTLLKVNETSVVNKIEEKLGTEEFFVYMNCVNRRGNTLLAEALRLNLQDTGEKLMTLRLKAVQVVDEI